MLCIYPVDRLLFLLLTWSLLVYASDNGSEFISIVPEGSVDKCGYQSFGPALFEMKFDAPLKPVSVDQWVNGTIKVTPTMEIRSGTFKFELNIWPHELRFPFCDLGHGEELCPLKKDVEITLPFEKFFYSYFLIPGHTMVNITAVTDQNEIAARVGVDCTIRPAIHRFFDKGFN